MVLSLFSSETYALQFFLDGLFWRATESNNWAYLNSETTPNQTLNYKTIDFNYAPGFRVGLNYRCNWDALFSYTRFYTSTSDSAVGNIQPSFSGSVTAKPSAAYLYSAGHVSQSINYNIFDLDFGKEFTPINLFTFHPYVGLIGGWINQYIHAEYQGSTSANEKISNNFTGVGPKFGIDTKINFCYSNMFKPQFFVNFATSYLAGHWNIRDTTTATPSQNIHIRGASHNMGSLALQGSIGFKFQVKEATLKLAYEINDWLDQTQFFDNDTGAHNNDLVLQGLTLGISFG